MNKKLFTLLLIGILAIVSVSASRSLCYSRKCDKCEYNVAQRVNGATRTIAWRVFEIPHKKIDGKIYTTYRCDHGHEYLVNIETGEPRFLENK